MKLDALQANHQREQENIENQVIIISTSKGKKEKNPFFRLTVI